MTIMTKILVAGLGGAAVAASAPGAAQIYPFGNTSQFAVQRCTAAVQNRINRMNVQGAGGYGGGRVVSVTRVEPKRNRVIVRGLATSGLAYNPYGYGAYGALGYGYAQPANATFRCSVDYRGRVTDVDIVRRR
jgi:hypothetical protein